MPFNKILVIGGAGNLGTLLLKHLSSSPAKFSVSVLSRQTSHSSFPSNVNVLRVPDDYPHDALVSAFKGHSCVISTISMMGMHLQPQFISACIAAGVQRYFPTEYGLDSLPDWLVELRPMFATKHDIRDLLVEKEKEGLEWTGVVCNVFFEMGVQSGFFGFDWADKKVTMIDVDGKGAGESKWVATTLDTVAIAIVKAIEPERAEKTKNKLLLIQDFRTSQSEILDSIEKGTGKKWNREEVKYDEWLEGTIKQVKGGDDSGLSKLTFATVVTGSQWEEREEFANKLLELPTKTFKEAMDSVLKEI